MVVNVGASLNIGIVSPGYPERPGGVTDHTARLVRHWSEAGCRVAVEGAPSGDPQRVVAGWRDAEVGAILIQYVPFLYGRRGLSRFPRGLAVAARAAGLRVGLFVHEPWVPLTRLPWLVLSPLQRGQLRRLVQECDLVVTPVPAWGPMLGGEVSIIHVGSNLGDPPPAEGSPLPSPVVFSPFAAGLRWQWIVAAVKILGAHPALTVIGADWETARRHPVLKQWADPAWDWRGRLNPGDVLSLLARARVVLAPFQDGLTGRRGSALAAMSVGAPLVSNRGPLYDGVFDASPFAVAGTKDEFCSLAQRMFQAREHADRRQERLAWHRRHLAPSALDQRLLALVLGSAHRSGSGT